MRASEIMVLVACIAFSSAYVHLTAERFVGVEKSIEISNAPNTSHLFNRSSQNHHYGGWTSDKIRYAVDLQVGSAGEYVRVLVDTGSGDLLVNGQDNPLCQKEKESSSTERLITLQNQYPTSTSILQSLTTQGSNKKTGKVKRDDATTYTTGWNIYFTDITVTEDLTVTATSTVSQQTTLLKTVTHTKSTSSSVKSTSFATKISSSSKNHSSTTKYDTSFFPSVSGTTNWLTEYPTPAFEVGDVLVKDSSKVSCYSGGLFNNSGSDSFETNNTKYIGVDINGDEVTGEWGMDVVQFGTARIDDLQFVVVNNSDQYGTLGLGLPSQDNDYDNFIVRLKLDGWIERMVYSIGVSSNNKAAVGSLIFGGVDLNQAVSNFTLVPLLDYPDDSNGTTTLAITLSKLFSVDNKRSSLIASGLSYSIIDTTSLFGTVPYYIYDEIVASGGFMYEENSGNFVSNYTNLANRSITWDFQGFEISTSLLDLTLPLISEDEDSDKLSQFVVLAIESHPYDYFILGDAILSKLYFVVDLEFGEIALAERNLSAVNKATQDIVDILEDEEIPNASIADLYHLSAGYNDVTLMRLATYHDINIVASTSFKSSLAATQTTFFGTFEPTNLVQTIQ